MPIVEFIQTLQTFLQDTTEVARSPPQSTIFVQLLSCLAQYPYAFTLRYPKDKKGRGVLEPHSQYFHAL